jgi:hypothetical protein
MPDRPAWPALCGVADAHAPAGDIGNRDLVSAQISRIDREARHRPWQWDDSLEDEPMIHSQRLGNIEYASPVSAALVIENGAY